MVSSALYRDRWGKTRTVAPIFLGSRTCGNGSVGLELVVSQTSLISFWKTRRPPRDKGSLAWGRGAWFYDRGDTLRIETVEVWSGHGVVSM